MPSGLRARRRARARTRPTSSERKRAGHADRARRGAEELCARLDPHRPGREQRLALRRGRPRLARARCRASIAAHRDGRSPRDLNAASRTASRARRRPVAAAVERGDLALALRATCASRAARAGRLRAGARGDRSRPPPPHRSPSRLRPARSARLQRGPEPRTRHRAGRAVERLLRRRGAARDRDDTKPPEAGDAFGGCRGRAEVVGVDRHEPAPGPARSAPEIVRGPNGPLRALGLAGLAGSASRSHRGGSSAAEEARRAATGHMRSRIRSGPSSASASSAATRPSGVCSSASTSGSTPCSRSAALVAGPIETRRGPRARPPPRRRSGPSRPR